MAEAQIERLNHVFRALADPTRREMIRRLAEQNLTVTELAMPYKMSLAGASKHIKVLEEAHLVRGPFGAARICVVSIPRLWLPLTSGIQFYESFWNDQLDALERELNEPETNA